MNAEQKMRLTIICDIGSDSYRTECVATATVHQALLEQIEDVSRQFVCFQARLNDIDGNGIDYKIRRDCIFAVEAVTVNGME